MVVMADVGLWCRGGGGQRAVGTIFNNYFKIRIVGLRAQIIYWALDLGREHKQFEDK